jgi:hypothetical protein
MSTRWIATTAGPFDPACKIPGYGGTEVRVIALADVDGADAVAGLAIATSDNTVSTDTTAVTVRRRTMT